MDRIKSLYGRLGRAEKKALRNYLGLFGNKKGEDKPLALLKMLDKNPNLDQEEAAEKLYGNVRSKAFGMMKKRLYERMVEFLPLSLNPAHDRYDKSMPYFHDLIAFRKNMLIATTLQEMRLGPLATEHFEKALQLARSCHNAELEADVLVRLRGTLQLHQLPVDDISEQLHHALEATERDAHVLGVHHEFLQLNNLKTSGTLEMIEFLDRHVPELDLRLQQFYSARADYYLQILNIHYARLRWRYEEGKAAALKARQLIADHQGLRSRQRLAEPPYQLAIHELKFQHFDAAYQAFSEARPFLKPHSQSFFLLSTMMLYPLVYQRRYEEARQEGNRIADMVREGNFAGHERVLELADYLLACVAYFQGNLKAARRRLSVLDELHQDKSGWATGIRIFEVVLLVELGEMEMAEQRVESLRKHMKRHPGNEREELLVKLLRGQARIFFSFEGAAGENEILEQLESTVPWDPVGHEVVRVDEWFRKKRAVATP